MSELPRDALQHGIDARFGVLAQLDRRVEAALREVQRRSGSELRESRHVGVGDLGDPRIAPGRLVVRHQRDRRATRRPGAIRGSPPVVWWSAISAIGAPLAGTWTTRR